MQLRVFPEKAEFMNLAGRGNVIPVCMDILADTETPLSALAKVYSGKGPVFLLESVEGGERWGRYSFLGASAQSNIRVYRDKVEVENDGPASGNPSPWRPASYPEVRHGRIPAGFSARTAQVLGRNGRLLCLRICVIF